MKTHSISTPAFLLDEEILKENITAMARLCKNNRVELWPMVKTHKSRQIAMLQNDAGASGFLAGTLHEAEMLVDAGIKNIMLAYPVAGRENITRLAALLDKARIILALDGMEAAREVSAMLKSLKRSAEFLLIIDSGFHRFGVSPEEASGLLATILGLGSLEFSGISTHPGHVYKCSSFVDVAIVAEEENSMMEKAAVALGRAGFHPGIIASGSTPTAALVAGRGVVNILRPGNYVFYDNIQLSLGIAEIKDCALTVLATVISRPKANTLIIDAGSKCLGLDRGAHGTSSVTGFGRVKGHADIIIDKLSEEVGTMAVPDDCQLLPGDKVEIIPNHACAAASNTSFMLLHSRGRLSGNLEITARGGIKSPLLS